MWFQSSYIHIISASSQLDKEELSGQDSVYVILFIYDSMVVCRVISMQGKVKRN